MSRHLSDETIEQLLDAEEAATETRANRDPIANDTPAIREARSESRSLRWITTEESPNSLTSRTNPRYTLAIPSSP